MITVYNTGHPIADRVAVSLRDGLRDRDSDFAIGYGILRGMDVNLRKHQYWLELDRGYFKPSHYDGYYRISYRGTQQTGSWVAPDYERLIALNLELKPWRGFDHSKPVLVCPPTDAVAEFFGISTSSLPMNVTPGSHIRKKGDTFPINFSGYNYVLTFNSSVGWQALQAGIPCVSDPTHSMVGSWYKNISLENLADAQYIDRKKLFATMAGSQFTLAEIEQGKTWDYIKRYIPNDFSGR